MPLRACLRDVIPTIAWFEREGEVSFLPCAPRVDELMASHSHIATICLQLSDVDNLEIRRFYAVDQVGGDVVVIV